MAILVSAWLPFSTPSFSSLFSLLTSLYTSQRVDIWCTADFSDVAPLRRCPGPPSIAPRNRHLSYDMQITARWPRLWLMTSIQTIQAGVMNFFNIIRSGSRTRQRYSHLNGAREQSRYYYSRTTKRTWTIAGIVAASVLVFWYFVSGPPLPATFFRAFVASGERKCWHPVARLVYDASTAFNDTLDRQSTSLEEAVAEYRRRYKMPPPPHFDNWYKFARDRNTTLIDEFDTIYHSLLPFWGLAPSTIRARVQEDLGGDTFLMGISIRNGRPIHLGHGQGDFQKNGTMKILEKFSQWLPDMDLGFNAHDEPRVVVAHDDLQRLVAEGYAAQARLNENSTLASDFSARELVDPIPQVSTSRFNNIERQETWLYSRLSCPPDSPARDLNGNAPDNTSAYAIEPLGFVFNQSAASDICNSPSLRHRLGVFERPNSFKLTNELTPVFSMSHPSSFQDIPVPSPFYYEGIASYDDGTSIPWSQKNDQLYWRGATTGGHSRNGTWHNLQRQRVIGNLTHPESTPYILAKKENSNCRIGGDDGWEVQPAYDQISNYFNTHFVDIVDCDDDCEAEQKFFDDVVDADEQSEAWKYKYLLDMDGHAYSGRFYAFMRSSSVPFKLTFFREWHENVLIPWVHYVPLNKDADEIPELVRFFDQDPAGQEIAKTIGGQGQAWAKKSIRNEDMEVYMFRLLLEYVDLILSSNRAC